MDKLSPVEQQLYMSLLKADDAPCSAQTHYDQAILLLLEKLDESDEFFAEPVPAEVKNAVIHMSMLGYKVTEHLMKYIGYESK